jgi:hypothetical protein
MEQNERRVIKFRAWDGKQMVEDAARLLPDGDAELAAFGTNILIGRILKRKSSSGLLRLSL